MNQNGKCFLELSGLMVMVVVEYGRHGVVVLVGVVVRRDSKHGLSCWVVASEVC